MNNHNINKSYVKPSAKIVHVEVGQMLASSPLPEDVSLTIDPESDYEGEADWTCLVTENYYV